MFAPISTRLQLLTYNIMTEGNSNFLRKCCYTPVMRSPIWRLALLLGAIFLGWCNAACIGHPRPIQVLRIDIVPQLSPTVIYSQWAPLLERVGQNTGFCFDLFLATSIPDFEKSLWAGRPDLAFANPYHAVIARERQKYIPLIRDGKEKLSGILVVPRDSSIKNLKDLQGKQVAFPAPNAFAASLLIRAHLAQIGIRVEPQYLTTHANVYRSVALGELAAGGGVNSTLEREEANLRNRLRILYETPSYAAHPLLAHPRLSNQIREKLTQAFLDLSSTASGRALLDTVQIPQPIRADYTRDYAPLMTLNLEPFVVSDGQ
jgi:phosphonate transport system substrate-binding protein